MIKQGSVTRRVVNAWKGLPGKMVSAETVDEFELELDRYREASGMEGVHGYWQGFPGFIGQQASSCV